ncbi:MAG: polysaccharide deacetylase family protein [Deltaproteobacteria bacterium]|nr:polysaccharide deacetylase family protein [Deltaproteobacteria bacterium]
MIGRTASCSRALLVLCIILVLFPWVDGCIPALSERGKGLSTPAGKKRGMTFRSDDYVVYRLEGWETPADLAKIFLGDQSKAWIIEDENKDVHFEKGRHVVIPLREEKKGGLGREGYQVVPILRYHRFGKDCNSPLCISPQLFELQMRYLKDHGYRVITLDEMKGFLTYRRRIPERSVVVTIDDGDKSFYDIALPILNKYGFKAAIFIYTGVIGRSNNALNWDQLREIKALGFDIGSHGVSRGSLTKQRPGEDERGSLERVEKELADSKKVIDRNLNQDTDLLAYPFEKTSPRILLIAERVGYSIGLTDQPGSNPFFADPMSLKRWRITEQDKDGFIASLQVFKRFFLRENSGEN